MAKRARNTSAGSESSLDIPVVGMREPCPCGSGRRYKACHGKQAAQRGERLVSRPFAGLPGEADWVAMRELVPSATATVSLVGEFAGRSVTVATVLPLAWPALHRADGTILLGLQTQTGSGDLSRDLADALERALASEPGTPVPPAGIPDEGRRLQDLIDLSAPLNVVVHQTFDFWMDESTDMAPDVAESLRNASDGIIPTVRLESVESAYWCDVSTKEHLRWVLDRDEDRALSALARLHVAHELGLVEGSRFVGSFRALGLIIPVWDLESGTGAEALEPVAGEWLQKFDQAYADMSDLTSAERRARAGLVNRQLTLN